MMGVEWDGECLIVEKNRCMMGVLEWVIEEWSCLREGKKVERGMIRVD